MSEVVKGVAPGFLLLPAREYDWKLESKVQIELPNEGTISELLAESDSGSALEFPGENEFCLFGDNLLLLWEIVRVMFVTKKYPDLEDSQCLNVVAIQMSGDKVVVHGEIIRSM